ncbi:MAG: phosphohistidine phosphatase SixA [Bryobacteraceae bacterium]
MQLYILRHGIAENGKPGGSDADRALTAEGKKKLRETLRAVAKAGVAPELMISSPYLRARETAEIAMEVLGYREALQQADVLIPSTDPKPVWEEIRLHKTVASLMLVGHEPLLSVLAAYLLGAPSIYVDMKKGAILRIDVESFGPQPHGILKWMLVPKLI